ncbi:MAG TPA: c-type cytochrome [Reyranella sp.]|jgi:cytochrome c553|nr:c-type cytochrome [Reyranella sp.]
MSAKSNFIVQTLAASALFAAVAAATSPAAAQAAPPVKPPAIAQTCTACHGAKGISSTRNTPSLAGQPDIFTQYQLVFMRDGGRQPGVMQAVVKNLTDDNIRDLGAYYAALPPPPALATTSEVAIDTEKVTGLLTSRHCDSCHKPDFAGQGESARLAGQRPEYLKKALIDFRTGVRRGRGMGAMIEVSVTLHEQEIDMIAAYLARKP